MEHYCTFNLGTGLWDAIVPISWHGIKKAPRESLGSYLRQPDAVAAVEEFFTFVDNYRDPKSRQALHASESDAQTIMALRIRVKSLETANYTLNLSYQYHITVRDGYRVPSGKHKGKRISELPGVYKDWVLNQGVEDEEWLDDLQRRLKLPSIPEKLK